MCKITERIEDLRRAGWRLDSYSNFCQLGHPSKHSTHATIGAHARKRDKSGNRLWNLAVIRDGKVPQPDETEQLVRELVKTKSKRIQHTKQLKRPEISLYRPRLAADAPREAIGVQLAYHVAKLVVTGNSNAKTPIDNMNTASLGPTNRSPVPNQHEALGNKLVQIEIGSCLQAAGTRPLFFNESLSNPGLDEQIQVTRTQSGREALVVEQAVAFFKRPPSLGRFFFTTQELPDVEDCKRKPLTAARDHPPCPLELVRAVVTAGTEHCPAEQLPAGVVVQERIPKHVMGQSTQSAH
ncbi:DEAD-box ATP-dependent RNA helicase 41 [Striga asiatica]|uniref:DEAD-box ATP-dependent RNA helicase 41 n=1 Tax=Striga asiatica TaxID=4170 RepID=A0A5A7PN42_STRAF|nr:DEAD-box ATP-dependent RNA helicase 41 [Striga asiatica]